MNQELTKFEQESTKPPVWLPITGVIVFFIIVILGVMCTGDAPEIPDGGQVREQTE